MAHVVLKPFGWYPDGYTREALEVGDERDFGDATKGLLAAKMIGDKPVDKVVHVSAESNADVTEPETSEPHPLDHDGDGRKGGSLPGRRKRK